MVTSPSVHFRTKFLDVVPSAASVVHSETPSQSVKDGEISISDACKLSRGRPCGGFSLWTMLAALGTMSRNLDHFLPSALGLFPLRFWEFRKIQKSTYSLVFLTFQLFDNFPGNSTLLHYFWEIFMKRIILKNFRIAFEVRVSKLERSLYNISKSEQK